LEGTEGYLVYGPYSRKRGGTSARTNEKPSTQDTATLSPNLTRSLTVMLHIQPCHVKG
jgi:hypothetical protein